MRDQGSSYPDGRDIRNSEAQGDIAADEERRKGIKEHGFIPWDTDGKEEKSEPHGKSAKAA